MNMDEGKYLYNKVLETNASNILEFGLGNAIYTIYLLMAVYKTHGYVTSIDSTQTEQWNQRGVQLIDAMRLKSWHKWIDVDDFIYIKRILSQKSYKNLYTIIYINGRYSPAYSELISNFIDKVLQLNGLLIIDEFRYNCTICNGGSIHSIIDKWAHYKRINSPRNFIVFQKLSLLE
jgi:hypothetical protein